MQEIALTNITLVFVVFTFFFTIWLDRIRNRVKGPIFYFNRPFLQEAKYYSSQNFTNLQFILNIQNGGDRPGTLFLESMILSLEADNDKFELKFKPEGDNPYAFEMVFQINYIDRRGFNFRNLAISGQRMGNSRNFRKEFPPINRFTSSIVY
ncbi:MAG: hypothetical protein HeimC3_53430 [Candidatus Heimdallarchaeota archaeon LC_3]|nr:MAG: hypothetical protein HeimC3_53430 [Candidatus Heimdallarchaeota archaeon LC_3]